MIICVIIHSDYEIIRVWNQRYWESFDNYDNDGLAFLYIGGEGEASPGWLTYGMWYEWAQQHGAAMFVLEHRWGQRQTCKLKQCLTMLKMFYSVVLLREGAY